MARSRTPSSRSRDSRSPPRGRMVSRSPSRSRSPLPVRRGPSPPPRGRSYTRSPSHSRSPSRSRSRSPPRYRRRRSSSPPPPLPSSKIVIEKLTKNITEKHIHEIFSHYGKIESIDIPQQRFFPVNRGVAYVIFAKTEEADAAIEHMHEGQIDGTQVNVSIVLSRRPQYARGRSRSPPIRRRFASPPRRGYGPPQGGRGRYSPVRRGGPGGFRGGYRGGYGGGGGRGGTGSDSYRPRSRSRSPYRGDRGEDRSRRRRSPSYSSYSSRSPSPARGRSRTRTASPRRGRDRSVSRSPS